MKFDEKLIRIYEPIQFFMQNSIPDPKLDQNWSQTRFWSMFEIFEKPEKNIFLGQLNENVLEKKFHFKIRDEKMPTESYLNHATLR